MKYPKIRSKNHSIAPLKLNKEFEIGEEARYPLDRYEYPVLIVHGSRTSGTYEDLKKVIRNKGVVLNHPDSIRNASDKLLTKRLLEEHEVATTPFIHGKELIHNNRFNSNLMLLRYPIVAKKRAGMGGEGMKLLTTKDELSEWHNSMRNKHTNKYLSSYIFEEAFNFGEDRDWTTQQHNKSTREYRIGVSPLLVGTDYSYTYENLDVEGGLETVSNDLGYFVSLRKKMRSEAVSEGAFGRNLNLGNSFFVRDFDKDYEWKKKGMKRVWSEGVDMCVKAVSALGLDYGAVDIMWSSDTGKWSILEVNTAPSMGNPEEGHSYTMEQWRQAFIYMIKTKHLLTT